MGLTEKSFLERNEEMGIFKTDCNVKSNQSADLISRAAVLARFKALQEYDPEHEGRGWACNFLNDSREPSTEWYCVENVVEDMPAVDAAPVRHGHWIYRERHRKSYRQYTGFDSAGETHTITVLEESEGKEPYCSECGAQAAESFMDFCPRCGANMDGK